MQKVVDVLDMWAFIEEGYELLTDADKARIESEAEPFGKYVTFPGFDGNYETERLGIARFLIDKMGRFERFKGRDLNSHHPTTVTYDRMLEVFEPIRVGLIGRRLSACEIIKILIAKKVETARA